MSISTAPAAFALLILMNILQPVIAKAEVEEWTAWKYRMPIHLSNRNAGNTAMVPVDVNFSLFADQLTDAENEIRLILIEDSAETEIPFQLSRLSTWTKNTDGEKSRKTINGRITFFDTAKSGSDAEYCILYGNPNARKPKYDSDLIISGPKNALVIENSEMKVTFHSSGQMSSVTLKNNPDMPVAPNTNVLHWNPGVYIPTVHWAHAFDWDPPETFEIETGPLFIEIKRSGVFPKIPDVHLSVTYRLFSRRAFVESSTMLNTLEDIGVVALRNDELVFDELFFTRAAWEDSGTQKDILLDDYEPVNRHGDIIRLSDTAPWISLYNPETGIGAATIRAMLSAIGPDGGPAVLFDNATYLSNGHLQYWFRPQVYFHVGWDRKQLITVPKGSRYAERNLYLFYEPVGNNPAHPAAELSKAVRKAPLAVTGAYALPPNE